MGVKPGTASRRRLVSSWLWSQICARSSNDIDVLKDVVDAHVLHQQPKRLSQSEAARCLGISASFLGFLLMLERSGLLKLPDPLPDKIVESKDLMTMVRESLKTLTVREQAVLTMRFGLNGDEPKTLSDTGASFGRSTERARQIQAKALRKLLQPSRSKYIRGCLTSLGWRSL